MSDGLTLRDLPLCTALRELFETVSPDYRHLCVTEVIRRSRHGDKVAAFLVDSAIPRLREVERNERSYSDTVLDDVAKNFCFEAKRQVNEWRNCEEDEDGRRPRKPTFNSVAVAIYPGARSHANKRANKAITPERLARLGLTNALDELSADTERTARP